ncbi:right-handed parallel beta-helix repeat-containing protein [Anaerobaca lacustris]|uniref:Right-handed parallel beta-helix repeat-containing protein n=1 Tax=Anaerobaca lacustris TaxID=3044600 RepID=A0AAW6U472_9BACT|nr:right-handed parallel beta-helix repeat-containing protein [Sedimentisphaerales bacterium M17dextr]
MKPIARVPYGVLYVLIAIFATGAARADWTYTYTDDFETNKAETDSCLHSVFRTEDVTPLPGPYLYYLSGNQGRGLGFVDDQDRPAELGYCFPIDPTQSQRVVKGTLEIDVSFPSNATMSQWEPGFLSYRISSNGMTWSDPVSLGSGRHSLPVSSPEGTCYITFSGARAVIDNLRVSLHSPAATIRVPASFATIQAAIDAAGHGDVIEVSPGTYSGPGNRDIDFRGKAITVRSTNGAAGTIIDCGPTSAATRDGHRGFYFHSGEGYDSVLSGFTIRTGRIFGTQVPSSASNWTRSASHPIGGGIYCEFSSPTIADCVIVDCGAEIGGGIGIVGGAPTLSNCTIRDCVAGGFGTTATGGRGGGIGLLGQSDATIVNCTIEGNAAYYDSLGGGLYCWESVATVAGTRISGNVAPGSLIGGGAYCGGSGADVTFRNCVFSTNAASAGAGLFAEWKSSFGPSSRRTRVTVVNCTIAGNQLSGASGSSAGGIQSSGVDILVRSSIVWGNSGAALTMVDPVLRDPVAYSNVQGGYSGEGNTNQDPLFANEWGEDYRLQSQYGRYNPTSRAWVSDGRQSPCIDAGDPSESVGDEPLPNGGRINMGAYGGTRQASKSPEYAVYHVDGATGRDWNNGLSRTYAFRTIQAAVNAARNGDTVLVWPGVYTLSPAEEVTFNRKAITVQSAADAAVIVATKGYAFSFWGAESSRSVVANFVITGSGQGAIFCDQGASPTLRNLTIVRNDHGIAAYGGADPDIVNCILWENSTGDLFGCKARYSCVQQGTGDKNAGNISVDPLFADLDNGDFHLKSRYGRYVAEWDEWVTDSVLSPCIDAGDPDHSPRAERTPNGNRINMGAYGGTPYASLSGWPPF